MSYRIFKEDDASLHMLHPDGSTFQVAKKALDEETIKYIKNKIPLHMAEGGVVPEQTFDEDAYRSKFASQLGGNGILGNTNPLAQLAASDTTIQAPEKIVPQGNYPAIEEARDTASQATPVVPLVADAGKTNKDPLGMKYDTDPAGETIRLKDVEVKPNPKDSLSRYGLLQTTQGEVEGIRERARAEAAQHKKDADDLTAFNESEKIRAAETQARYDSKQAQFEQARSDFMNGKLDPNRVWNSASTGNKVIAGIGMLLSGLGAGKDGHNLASDAIQKAIDRDIDAQKTEILKNKDLVNMSEQDLHNLVEWETNQRSQRLAAVDSLIKQNAARSGSPIALAQAKILENQVNQKAGETFQKYALEAQSLQGADPISAKIQYLLPKEQQAEANKELMQHKDRLKGLSNVDNIFKRYAEVQTVGNRISHPFASREEVGGLNAELTNAVAQATGIKRPELLNQLVAPFHVELKDDNKEIQKKINSVKNIIKQNSPSTPILSGRNWISDSGVNFTKRK